VAREIDHRRICGAMRNHGKPTSLSRWHTDYDERSTGSCTPNERDGLNNPPHHYWPNRIQPLSVNFGR
jgi:hypothetical protein